MQNAFAGLEKFICEIEGLFLDRIMKAFANKHKSESYLQMKLLRALPASSFDYIRVF